MGIKVSINYGKIYRKLGLDNGATQKRFVNRCRRYMDDYVPLDGGPLKNSAEELETAVQYVQPYARRQYYENKGEQRGRYWDKKMMAAKKEQLIRETERDLKGGL